MRPWGSGECLSSWGTGCPSGKVSHQSVTQKRVMPEAMFKRQLVVVPGNVRGSIVVLSMLLFVEYTYWTGEKGL